MTSGSPQPLVYVVDDDQEFRDSARWLLEAAGFQVSMYATAEHFLATWDPASGACVVLDVRMPGMSGIDLQDEMLRRGHTIPIIFVTGHGDVPTAVSAIKKGAVSFIEKPFNDGEFLELVGTAVRVNGPAFQEQTKQLPVDARLASLTQREYEVMERVVAGKANKMIADELGISARTVESHRAKVMEKTGANSIAELVRIALEAQSSAAARPERS